MQDAAKTSSRGVEVGTFATWATITAVAEAAFVFGLIMRLSWQACALVVLVATALGGAVFTIVEMRRLAKQSR